MSNQGWISLHRKIEDNPIFQNEKALKVWIWLLIRANHTDTDVLLGRQLIHLKSGQFIFGSDVACERLKMSKSTIHFWLNYMKVERYIERKTTNKWSIITILNYQQYQTLERKVGRQPNSKRILSVQQNETDNKEDKINNVNINTYISLFNKLFNSQAKVTSGRQDKLNLRLKTYSLQDVLTALTNLSRSAFHRGKNDRGWVADPDFLIRNDEQIDKWLNTGSTPKQKQNDELLEFAKRHGNKIIKD